MNWLDKWRHGYFVLMEAEIEETERRYRLQLERLNKKKRECSHTLSDGTSAFQIRGWNGHRDVYICQICGQDRTGLY